MRWTVPATTDTTDDPRRCVTNEADAILTDVVGVRRDDRGWVSSRTAQPTRSGPSTNCAPLPAPSEIVEVTGARRDLGSKTLDVPVLAVDAALRLLP